MELRFVCLSGRVTSRLNKVIFIYLSSPPNLMDAQQPVDLPDRQRSLVGLQEITTSHRKRVPDPSATAKIMESRRGGKPPEETRPLHPAGDSHVYGLR